VIHPEPCANHHRDERHQRPERGRVAAVKRPRSGEIFDCLDGTLSVDPENPSYGPSQTAADILRPPKRARKDRMDYRRGALPLPWDLYLQDFDDRRGNEVARAFADVAGTRKKAPGWVTLDPLQHKAELRPIRWEELAQFPGGDKIRTGLTITSRHGFLSRTAVRS